MLRPRRMLGAPPNIGREQWRESTARVLAETSLTENCFPALDRVQLAAVSASTNTKTALEVRFLWSSFPQRAPAYTKPTRGLHALWVLRFCF